MDTLSGEPGRESSCWFSEGRFFVPRRRRPVTAVATVDVREVVDLIEREPPGVCGLEKFIEGGRGARWKLESGRTIECRLVPLDEEAAEDDDGSFDIRTWLGSTEG